MFLARRILIHDPVRLILSVLGMALAITLAIVLFGVVSGVDRQTGDYLEHVPGSVAVTAAGTENFLLASAPLPPETAELVRNVPAVAKVVPILSQTVVLELHDRREATFLVGYEPGAGGAPARLSAGQLPQSDDEVVLSRLLAIRHDIEVGEQVNVLGKPFRVSGLAEDLTPLMTSFAYLQKSALEQSMLAPGATTLLLVTPADGVTPSDLSHQLGTLPGVHASLKSELIKNDVQIFSKVLTPPVRLMAGIALIVGTLVIGLVIYAATVERRGEYGVLKAIGSRNRVLYRIVAGQALLAIIPGVGLGLALAWAAARIIMTIRPEFLILITPPSVGLAATAGLVMALFAALIPTRVIAGLSPADVFRR